MVQVEVPGVPSSVLFFVEANPGRDVSFFRRPGVSALDLLKVISPILEVLRVEAAVDQVEASRQVKPATSGELRALGDRG